MKLENFMKLQAGDRIVIRFGHSEQYAIVQRHVLTRSREPRIWVAPFSNVSNDFYRALRRIAPGKVLRRCEPGEFTRQYLGD